jgi:hypothetical protein
MNSCWEVSDDTEYEWLLQAAEDGYAPAMHASALQCDVHRSEKGTPITAVVSRARTFGFSKITTTERREASRRPGAAMSALVGEWIRWSAERERRKVTATKTG